MDRDAEDLRLLSIFHYVVAGFAALTGLFPLAYMGIGVAMISGKFETPGKAGPPPAIGWVFIGLAVLILTFAWAYVTTMIVAGRSLRGGRRYTLCLVAAALSCMFMPFGTVLGVFTILVLQRPSVRLRFGVHA